MLGLPACGRARVRRCRHARCESQTGLAPLCPARPCRGARGDTSSTWRARAPGRNHHRGGPMLGQTRRSWYRASARPGGAVPAPPSRR
eukprot:3784164-Lingulodinium_polyedra.AAC.1